MKYLFQILILLLLISCSSKSENSDLTQLKDQIVVDGQINIVAAKIGNYSFELRDWLKYYSKYSIRLTEFEFQREDKLPDISAIVDAFDVTNDIFAPFYKYSPDSSIILDLISYNVTIEKNDKNQLVLVGSEPDSEVAIFDLENKAWHRILFVGTTEVIEDGFWINNNCLVIVGQSYGNDHTKCKPSIWFVDLEKDIIQTFQYNKCIDSLKCDYLEKVKFKKLIIAE